MKIDLPDYLLPVVIRALENTAAAMQSLGKDDRPYLEGAEYFRQAEAKPVASEDGKPRAKRKSA